MAKEVVFLDDNEELIDPRQIMMDAFIKMGEELPFSPPPKAEDHQIINTPVAYYEQVIPEDLVNLIAKEYHNIPKEQFVESEIGSNAASALTYSKIRDSRVTWWYETHWVSSIFAHYFNHANREIWEYDLNHLDGIQVTTYDQKGHYAWHSDYGTTTDRKYTRKLSASLLLSDPEEYEGGRFQILDYHGKVINPPQKKGTMIIFDSRVPHRVTKIKSGKRISLVSWMLGPKLR
jgi:PKHD-type hydroxylase